MSPDSLHDTVIPELLRRVKLVVFDFDGVFTDNTVYVSTDGAEMVRCWRGDGIGLAQLADAGVATMVISTEANAVVARRCEKMRVDYVHGCADKLAALKEVMARVGVDASETAFLGNDVNDASCLREVALPVVVADAHEDVSALAALRTQAAGGRGAVRELCDLVLAHRP